MSAYKCDDRRRGHRHWNAKITEDIVRQIRAAQGRYKDIAAAFKISAKAVCEIKNRKSWGHVV